MQEIIERIRKFRDDRDWMQFHDPNGADAERVARENKDKVADEIADVAIYMLELCDRRSNKN